jgi:hypothetical protein
MDLLMNALVETAVKVYREHTPTSDGGCPMADCPDATPRAGDVVDCLPYRMADAVLTMWAEPDDGQWTGLTSLPAVDTTQEVAGRNSSEAPATGAGDGSAHPSWCAGAPYCCVPDGLGHVSRPVVVGQTTIMLTSVNSAVPMVGIMAEDGEIILPARDSDELGTVLHELSALAFATA